MTTAGHSPPSPMTPHWGFLEAPSAPATCQHLELSQPRGSDAHARQSGLCAPTELDDRTAGCPLSECIQTPHSPSGMAAFLCVLVWEQRWAYLSSSLMLQGDGPSIRGEHRGVQNKGGPWAVGCGVERVTSLSACIGLHRPQ